VSAASEVSLRALVGAARAMAVEPDPARAVASLASALREDLGVDRVGIFRLEQRGPRSPVLNRLFGIDAEGRPEAAGEVIPVQDVPTPLMDVARRRVPFLFTNDAAAAYPRHQFQPGLGALAVFPILAGEALVGVLCADNVLTGRPFSPEIQEALFLYASLAALPLFALHQAEEAERELTLRRHVHRDLLHSVTAGKIRLCDPGEIERDWPDSAPVIPLEAESDVGLLRAAAREAALHGGLSDERASDLCLCASEAATNALLHGNGGWGAVVHAEGRVRVRVTDRGDGIDPNRISHAALIRGWSSRASLGLGFTVMGQAADRVYVSTGREGTTVVIEMEAQPELVLPSGPSGPAWARPA
jgi:anti-sigma regulatory factor (Ser/Thr protein kinase)